MKIVETKTTVKNDGTKEYAKIRCPYCGTEFLPSEIYLRDYYLGKANSVERDEKNKVINSQGINQDMDEEFKCDFCDKKFVVEGFVNYVIKGVEFEEEYVTTIYKDRINLGA